MPATASPIRIGIGGWEFAPWRGPFYPEGLPHKQELEFASRHVTAIEVNGTFYRTQTPAAFARWRDETPDDFVFCLKASRYVTNRRVLAEAAPGIRKFLESGLTELGRKLGVINWQFAATKKFDPRDFEAFLALLPKVQDGLALRHAVELRHPSFAVPECMALLRRHGVAAVVADSDEYPRLHDLTAPFVYARLQRASEDEPLGYAPDALDAWAGRAWAWAAGGKPGLPLLTPAGKAQRREVFLFFINGFKPRAPAAAMALLERISTA